MRSTENVKKDIWDENSLFVWKTVDHEMQF